ncbi:MAG: D-arabinono-1,4-lactone oxidase [Acidimicrobiales bacterium]
MAISKDGSTFSNWAGNQIAAPVRIDRPRSEQQLAASVTEAANRGWTVKAVGAGHSFTDIALTSGLLLDLSQYSQVLKVDGNLVTVQSGIRLHDLAKSLASHGLALPNLGDIDAQSIAGAISTGTHGTGLGFEGVASCVVAMRVVTGDGELLDLDEAQLRVGRVGLGAAGLISTVTLNCVPEFWLRAQEDRRTLDEMLELFDVWTDEYDHAEFFWMPHTNKVLTKRNTRLFDEPHPVSRLKRARGRLATELSENVAYGALCRLGKSRPELIPRLAKAVVSGASERTYTAPSWEVFATPRRVKFVEMEYAIPREVWTSAFKEVQHLIDVIDEPVNFPIEVRVLGGDDISMSMANGRDSVFIAVHNYRGMAYERYFRGVESIMKRYEGRPHWGKLHYRIAEDLEPAYPDWDRFQALRQELDAPGTFHNPYLKRVLD